MAIKVFVEYLPLSGSLPNVSFYKVLVGEANPPFPFFFELKPHAISPIPIVGVCFYVIS
jgi:hypothetical protein